MKTITMHLVRVTKGAVRYQEVDTAGDVIEVADAAIGTLYLRKSALGGQTPTAITVAVSW